MKQITAVVNKNDSDEVIDALIEKGYYITKVSSTGGFLRSGSTTFISAVEDDQVQSVISIIEQHCSKRKQLVQSLTPMDYAGQLQPPPPVELTVGGATVIVTNIERFIKL